MAGNKILFLIFLCCCISSCVSNTVNEVRAEFWCTRDTKPCSDSLYEEYVRENPAKKHLNPRFIELAYSIKNVSNETIYLPLVTWLGNPVNTESTIKASFVFPNDTITPYISISKSPYKSNYINAGDSTLVFIKIMNFDEWESGEINVGSDIDTILSHLRLQYIKSPKDEIEDFHIPDIRFDSLPHVKYVIPRGADIYP